MSNEEVGPKNPTDRQEAAEAPTARPQYHSQAGLHEWLDNLPPEEARAWSGGGGPRTDVRAESIPRRRLKARR
jgi:hypothetical protein